MKTDVNGITVNYHLEGPGDGPVVTFSNSLCTTYRMWDPQAALLKDGYRVLRYDTRGHGGTSVTDGEYSMDLLADDAIALLRALDIDKTHWVGLSMGGMIGQAIALKNPDLIDRLVLADTSCHTKGREEMWTGWIDAAAADGLEPIVEALTPRWFTGPFIESRRDIVEPVQQMIRTTPTTGFLGCCHALRAFDLDKKIAAITSPTAIIVGAEDSLVEPSKYMQSLIAGASLHIIDSAGHLANQEQPEEFNTIIEDFLGGAAQ